LLDHNVVFAKGFFNETMPPLSKHVEKLSIMRLDVSDCDEVWQVKAIESSFIALP
jgi:hypothetical protein